MNRLLVTVDSLRYDHFRHMPNTRSFLDALHERAFATSTATLGSFPAIVGGEYPAENGLKEGTSVASEFSAHSVGITTNHLLSERYGYREGFDAFDSPQGGGSTLKEKGAVLLSRGTVPYRIATWGWNKYQRLTDVFGDVDKSFRPADHVISQFLTEIEDESEWFGWLHFMEPHHPYDPDGGPLTRSEAQRLTRSVLSGRGDEADFERVRELYRREVEELDEHLQTLWDAIPDDTRVVFAADHGELLGEDSRWGHPGEMRPELLRVPFGTRNAPEVGDVVSLIDVPSILRGEEHGRGTFDREVAYATYGDRKAAMDDSQIVTESGALTIDGEPTEPDPSLEGKLRRFEPDYVVKEDALREDLEDLGYA